MHLVVDLVELFYILAAPDILLTKNIPLLIVLLYHLLIV